MALDTVEVALQHDGVGLLLACQKSVGALALPFTSLAAASRCPHGIPIPPASALTVARHSTAWCPHRVSTAVLRCSCGLPMLQPSKASSPEIGRASCRERV